jgi:hypothetical protein
MQVWVKNYNASNVIDMQVLPSFENLFSATGYLGEAPQLSSVYGEYFNALKIFEYGQDFEGNVLPSGFRVIGLDHNNTYKIDNGLYITDTNITPGSTALAIWTNQSFPKGSVVYAFTTGIYNLGQSQVVGIDGNGGSGENFNGRSIGEIYYGVVGSGSFTITSGIYYINPVDNLIGISNYNTTGAYAWVNGNSQTYFLTGLGTNVFNSTSGIQAGVGEFSSYGGSSGTGYINISYFFVASPITSMPTFTIGTSLYHSIDFKLIGSSTSINWGIFINGTFYNANSSNIYLNMTNGYYNIIVNLPAGYSPIASNVLKVNNTNQIFKIVVVSQNNNSNFSNEIMYAIILASIIIAVALYFSRRK